MSHNIKKSHWKYQDSGMSNKQWTYRRLPHGGALASGDPCMSPVSITVNIIIIWGLGKRGTKTRKKTLEGGYGRCQWHRGGGGVEGARRAYAPYCCWREELPVHFPVAPFKIGASGKLFMHPTDFTCDLSKSEYASGDPKSVSAQCRTCIPLQRRET
jgi:hypothetical protein